MKKKIFVTAAIIASVILLSFLSACSTAEPTTTAASNPLTELSTRVSTAETNIATLNGEVSGIKTSITALSGSDDLKLRVSSLETQASELEASITSIKEDIDNLPDNADTSDIDKIKEDLDTALDGINATSAELVTIKASINSNLTRVNSLEADSASIHNTLTSLQTQINTLSAGSGGSTTPAGYQALLDDVAVMKTHLTAIDTSIASLQSSITAMQTTVDAANAKMEEIKTTFGTINDLWLSLNQRVVVIENIVNSFNRATISKFISGSSYVELTTLTAGNYIVVLTLYGTGLDVMTLYVPPSQNIEYVFDDTYSSGNMRVVILQPTPVLVGSVLTYPNWAANKVVEIDFTGSGFSVDYATITTGVR